VPVDGESPSPSADDDRNLTPSASAEGPADSSKVEQDIAALLSETEQKRDEYLELAQRTKADFENYRKRMAAEVQASSARGKTELARELIDPVDNLERALRAVGIDPDRDDPLGDAAAEAGDERDGFGQGVLFVFLGLRETLARHGIETLNPAGEKFDPQWHEALSLKPAEGGESGIVVEVMQKGYRLGDQLVRPARVVVTN
jgi:molecular chaperone GrpE